MFNRFIVSFPRPLETKVALNREHVWHAANASVCVFFSIFFVVILFLFLTPLLRIFSHPCLFPHSPLHYFYADPERWSLGERKTANKIAFATRILSRSSSSPVAAAFLAINLLMCYRFLYYAVQERRLRLAAAAGIARDSPLSLSHSLPVLPGNCPRVAHMDASRIYIFIIVS